ATRDEEAALLRATYSRRPQVRVAAIKGLCRHEGSDPATVRRIIDVLREYTDGETLNAALEAVVWFEPKAAGAREAVVSLLEREILGRGKWELLVRVVDVLEKVAIKDRTTSALLWRAAQYAEREPEVLQVKGVDWYSHKVVTNRAYALSEQL